MTMSSIVRHSDFLTGGETDEPIPLPDRVRLVALRLAMTGGQLAATDCPPHTGPRPLGGGDHALRAAYLRVRAWPAARSAEAVRHDHAEVVGEARHQAGRVLDHGDR